MRLRQVDVTQDSLLRENVKALYYAAFPKEERIPWCLLVLNAHRKGIDLTAWLDGDTFCGMTASVTVEGLHFLLFFAIDESLRGKGHGSAILTQLRQDYDELVLNVETLDPNASNYPQRLKRFAFYEKNGIYDTGWYVWEVGGKFRVLGTNRKLDTESYKKVFRKLTFGIWNVKLKEERKS